MPRYADYIAAYDLSHKRERDRTAKILEGFGFRVQKSVFELRLTRGMREQLLQKLATLDLKSGFVSVYRRGTGSKRYDAGNTPERSHDENRHAFIF